MVRNIRSIISYHKSRYSKLLRVSLIILFDHLLYNFNIHCHESVLKVDIQSNSQDLELGLFSSPPGSMSLRNINDGITV